MAQAPPLSAIGAGILCLITMTPIGWGPAFAETPTQLSLDAGTGDEATVWNITAATRPLGEMSVPAGLIRFASPRQIQEIKPPGAAVLLKQATDTTWSQTLPANISVRFGEPLELHQLWLDCPPGEMGVGHFGLESGSGALHIHSATISASPGGDAAGDGGFWWQLELAPAVIESLTLNLLMGTLARPETAALKGLYLWGRIAD